MDDSKVDWKFRIGLLGGVKWWGKSRGPCSRRGATCSDPECRALGRSNMLTREGESSWALADRVQYLGGPIFKALAISEAHIIITASSLESVHAWNALTLLPPKPLFKVPLAGPREIRSKYIITAPKVVTPHATAHGTPVLAVDHSAELRESSALAPASPTDSLILLHGPAASVW